MRKKKTKTGTTSAAVSALAGSVRVWHLARLGTITPDDPARALTLLSVQARSRRGDDVEPFQGYGTMLLMLLSAAASDGLTPAQVCDDAASVAALLTAEADAAEAASGPDTSHVPDAPEE